MTDNLLKKIAYQRRLDALNMIYRAKTGHIGGTMSSLDILTVLFYDTVDVEKIKAKTPDRDCFVLSKGHCVEGYYAILADLGFFPKEELATYGQFQTRLICHPTRKVPGIEANTGSLGHGLALGVGMAIAKKRAHLGGNVYVVMGDGEQAEGSVWEAAMAAGHYGLDNLYAFVDRNRLQISGCTEDVMSLEPLAGRYQSFGFAAQEINGHSYAEIRAALHQPQAGKPHVFIANTVKGKGIPEIENIAAWHHKVPDDEQYARAVQALTQVIDESGK